MINEKNFKRIQSTLRARWDQKLPFIIKRSVAFASQADLASQKLVREAYASGYREGYWDGVLDIMDAGTEAIPEEEPYYREH